MEQLKVAEYSFYASVSWKTKIIHKISFNTEHWVYTSKFIWNLFIYYLSFLSISCNQLQKHFLQIKHHIELLLHLL